MADLSVKTTSTPSQKDLGDFLDLLSTSYQGVPLTTAFIAEIDRIQDQPYSQPSAERLRQHFSLGLPTAFKSNISLTTARSSNSALPIAAVLFEPSDFRGTPPAQARRQPGPILSEYRALARQMKATHLAVPESGPHAYDTPAAPSQASSGPSGDPYPNDFNKDIDVEIRPFYHLSLLVRDTNADDRSSEEAIRAIMRVYLDQAKEEDVPIFLEASSESSRKEFETLGFQVVGNKAIGVGRCDEKGWPAQDNTAEGVMIWAMVYNA